MYSKITAGGHPVHPMLIGFPVASYVGTLVAFAVYASNGSQFWLNLAIALNVVGVGSALLAALPGIADLALGVPRGSAARNIGVAHGSLNIAALALFSISLANYVTHWDGPPVGTTLGLGLSAAGVACTAAAGFLGWMLVQDYHIGVRLTPTQEHDELAVQSARRLHVVRHRRAA